MPAMISTNKNLSDCKLRLKDLNVSRGGKYYERAASRRSRHRYVLQESHAADEAVPLKRKRNTTIAGTKTTKRPKTIFEENREELDKQLDLKAVKRISVLRDRILSAKKGHELRQVEKPQVLLKQKLVRRALLKHMTENKTGKDRTKKIDESVSSTNTRVDSILKPLDRATRTVSPPIRKKTIFPVEPPQTKPLIPNTQPAVQQPRFSTKAQVQSTQKKSKTVARRKPGKPRLVAKMARVHPAHKLPKIAMRRKPVRPHVAVVPSRVVFRRVEW